MRLPSRRRCGWFPEQKRPRLSKVLRTTAFAYPYLFDSIPLLYRLCLCSGVGCTQNAALPMHIWHFVFAFLTAFLFATHLPERLAPGFFDFVGHSHQLFHVCGALGTYFQIEVLIMDMNLRKDWLMNNAPVPSFSSTMGAWLLGMFMSLIVIGCFSSALYWKPQSERNKRKV
ncbi:hypothetical protein GDO86_006520 [Hymenochirus boettgeri]|uniref:Uncharacterized protein n=1 Tax=Hymenochirus boettgeri TaxID=247094 RepID=A0A8T2JE03_9PIPI|nr:hypothetical protein GDO86_006520 [Hymenochirus boettgeri]